MTDREKPALTETEIETLAWDLETKMMRIRKDPQAALAEGLAKIRAQQLEDLHALWAKVEAEICEKRQAIKAEMEEEWAKVRASREADIAQLDEEWKAAVAKLRATRARQVEAAEARLLQ